MKRISTAQSRTIKAKNVTKKLLQKSVLAQFNFHCTNDYRTELYYFRITFGDSCSVLYQTHLFLELIGLCKEREQCITKSLGLPYRSLGLAFGNLGGGISSKARKP